MALAPTPCLHPGCFDPTIPRASYCPHHLPHPFQTSTRKSRLPRDWQTRRRIVLKRDRGVCHLCGEPGADTVDHIIPGDDHTLNNLAPVHDRTPPHCHRYKTASEAVEARKGARPVRRK